MEKISIYVDGSGIIDRGQYYGGYGVIVYLGEDEAMRQGIMVLGATNNTMELRALHDAIVIAKRIQAEYDDIEIYSDSQYSLNIIENIEKYKNNNWMTASTKKTQLKNINSIKKIYNELDGVDWDVIKLTKVKAHDSSFGNNQVDVVAKNSARALKKAFDKNEQDQIEFEMDWK